MSVELKVVLVGDDEAQQNAFNNPNASQAPAPIPPVQASATPTPPPIQSQLVQPAGGTKEEVVPPPIQSSAPTATATTQTATTTIIEAPPIQESQGRELIDSIEELIEAIDAMVGARTESSTPRSSVPHKPESEQLSFGNFFEKFAGAMDRKLSELGLANTAVGDMLANLTHMVANIGTRVTTAASTIAAPVLGLGGRAAAAAPAATETAAAGAGAAAGTEAAAATGGLASAAGAAAIPLVAIAAVGAASVLSLKAFMDAVERAAGNLQDLSPEIAGVKAQFEVTMELARLDRARRIGPEVAQIDAARQRINESMYEVQTKAYEIILKGAPFIENILDAVNMLVKEVNVLAAAISAAMPRQDPNEIIKAQKQLAAAVDDFSKSIEELGKTNKEPDHKGRDPMFDEFLKSDHNPPAKAPRQGNGLRGDK